MWKLGKGQGTDQKTYSRLLQAAEDLVSSILIHLPHSVQLTMKSDQMQYGRVCQAQQSLHQTSQCKAFNGKDTVEKGSHLLWIDSFRRFWSGQRDPKWKARSLTSVQTVQKKKKSTCCLVLSCTSPRLVFAALSSVCCYLKDDDILCVCVCVFVCVDQQAYYQ